MFDITPPSRSQAYLEQMAESMHGRGGDGVCEGVRGEDEREGESERTGEVRRGCGRVREVQAE